MEANHCPGAACILFKIKDRQKVVLHTGDFRWNPNLLSKSATYRALVSQYKFQTMNQNNLNLSLFRQLIKQIKKILLYI